MRPKLPSFPRTQIRWVWVPVVASIVVVAVAMVCAVWSPVQDDGEPYGPVTNIFDDEVLPGRQLPRSLRQYGGPAMDGLRMAGFGFSYYIIFPNGTPMNPDMKDPLSFPIAVGRAGFPFRCLKWTFHAREDFTAGPVWVRGIEARQPTESSPLVRFIPLMPELIGMTLNVLIYWAAIVLGRLARRRVVVVRRRRMSLCVKCGYPIEPSVATCPECGEAYAGAASAEPNHA